MQSFHCNSSRGTAKIMKSALNAYFEKFRVVLEHSDINDGGLVVSLWHVYVGAELQSNASDRFSESEIRAMRIERMAYPNEEFHELSASAEQSVVQRCALVLTKISLSVDISTVFVEDSEKRIGVAMEMKRVRKFPSSFKINHIILICNIKFR